MAKKKKETKGVVVELDIETRGKLMLLKGIIAGIGVNKTLSELAIECLKIGLQSKLENMKQ